MTIKHDGVLSRIAYGYLKNQPEKVSLCELFWRVIWSALIDWPIRMICMSFFILVVSISAIAVGWWAKRSEFVRIPYLYRFPPIIPLGLWWIVHSISVSIRVGLKQSAGNGAAQATVIVLLFVLVMATSWFIPTGFKKLNSVISTSEPVQTLKAHLKAHKNKVCPIVEIK